MTEFDVLIVGSGLFGSVFAHECRKAGKKVLVIDRRLHSGGNIYCENVNGINVHKYGAHIFHTNDKPIWDYVNSFVEFNNYVNSPLAVYKDELYNLPFNMNTFHQLWKVKTPQDAKAIIDKQVAALNIREPQNLEEQALSLVGVDIYEKLIKGYTEKQWGRKASELPAFIIKRLPLRFTYNNNYFNDKYQGIPVGGYNKLTEGLLKGIEVRMGIDFCTAKEELSALAETVVFTGQLDEFYDYRHGMLEYRSLRFEHEQLAIDNYQGNAVVNYTEREVPYTRIIEHKHFEFGQQSHTVITREYPQEWSRGLEPYYPINDDTNARVYKLYKTLADQETNVIFGGRLAEYRYYDMHQVVGSALYQVRQFLKTSK
ncbi:UDP-galactopyranose mutase [Chitinophaga filiformis]|uniref:UDP-galactopyranose mutase n=1 Tax=Chitinophaga filiformis TaxID=104663 RepID=A0A1G7UDS7_CHIFI|nr:UDP-galactopyranose mutase [Chitinophaga filiformis]SDG45633.1 UDP-galactopyranose mutase [Chitinophaga filiformis]